MQASAAAGKHEAPLNNHTQCRPQSRPSYALFGSNAYSRQLVMPHPYTRKAFNTLALQP